MAAGFADRLPRLPVLDGYIDESQPDYVALEKIGMPVRCLISDNDDHVPTELSVRMAHALNSPIDWVADGGHLMASDGFTTLPAVWAALQPMLLGAKAA
ncbi:alpha/beta hydrolase [Snodgrassella sp. CFCC 13594]|uniref:alpha/beta hydrolase n=1 Tax=Snodgrassella sp. CFCC 13594 TaxID=1775559 RepID=UPI000A4F7033